MASAEYPLSRFDRTNRRLLETLETADGSCEPPGMVGPIIIFCFRARNLLMIQSLLGEHLKTES